MRGALTFYEWRARIAEANRNANDLNQALPPGYERFATE